MAQFPKVNPTPDGNAGAFFGRSIDIFEIDFNANVAANNGNTGVLIQAIEVVENSASIEVIGQAGTINLLGSNGNVSSSGGGLRVIVSPSGAWPNAATLQTAIRTSGQYGNGFIVAGNGSSLSLAAANVATITNIF